MTKLLPSTKKKKTKLLFLEKENHKSHPLKYCVEPNPHLQNQNWIPHVGTALTQ